ncbi:hypothetical protein IQ37_05745 [Chryseobacterium piperi]|uniref:Uncharacterized protein n=1 Tax=Chryseobacterium piperi TaxID=558152 RepID=A0A086BKQ4_9FLAO|nr:hypothetical protein [Chryseobacterium piperi]ATL75892.1 hypothetical protein CJF12_19915 [Chryseobacterium piperi]KFF29518.1 hypothetical protein IQ37_05745 [Chryseobacterium piperi]
MAGVDGFAKNGTVLADAKIGPDGEAGYVRLSEGGKATYEPMYGLTNTITSFIQGDISTWTAEEFPQITYNGGMARTDFDASTHDKKFGNDKTFNLDWGSFVAPSTFPNPGKGGSAYALSWAVDRLADVFNLNKGSDTDTINHTMGVFDYNAGKFKDTTVTLQYSPKVDFSTSNGQKTGKVDSVSLSNLRRYFNKH